MQKNRYLQIYELKKLLLNGESISVSKEELLGLNEDPIRQMYYVAVCIFPQDNHDLSDDEKFSPKDLLDNPPAFFIFLHRMEEFMDFKINIFTKFDCHDFQELYIRLTEPSEVFKNQRWIIPQCLNGTVLSAVYDKIRKHQRYVQHSTAFDYIDFEERLHHDLLNPFAA
jgi:hypothetical protein